jgi:aldose 1-epimerase
MPGITHKTIYQLTGKDIILFRLTNLSGSYVEVLNYGATLHAVVVPDRDNHFQNVVLNYKRIEDYLSDNHYIGSSIGRMANRITNAQFALNNTVFKVDKNDGRNNQHGGFCGFNKKIMDHHVHEDRVTFTGKSNDGEGGFPGNIHFSITYRFSDENELFIEYSARSDRDTPLNLTSHAYFNLSPEEGTVLHHELCVFSDEYLEMNNDFLPTGYVLSMDNSAFDFRTYREIAQLMPLKNEKLSGYNTYFVSRDKDNRALKPMASLKDNKSGRKMEVYSTMPGILFYTGDYLNGQHHPFEGLCLEAQFYPDFPNHSNCPACIIGPGKNYQEMIMFAFGNVGI